LFFKVDTQPEQIRLFHSVIEKFVADKASHWKSIIHLRTESTNNSLIYLEYSLRLEHQASHQRQSSILREKGELIRFCIKEMKKSGINFRPPHKPFDLFIKENCTYTEQDNQQQNETMKSALLASNLKSE